MPLSAENLRRPRRKVSRMNKECARLLKEYPPVVTLDQVYRICHISKRKGRWMLENGVIPCIDTGRKTHRFQVKMADIIDFLEQRECGGVTLPTGIFSNRRAYRKEAPPMLDERRFREYLEREWAALPDALTACEVAGLLGYHRTTVNSWATGAKSRLGKLPSIHYFGETVFAKEHLIAFLASTVNIGFAEKSVKHRALIEEYRQEEKNQISSSS